MAKLKVTQVKSKNRLDKRQLANLRTLGLRKIRQTVEVEKNPAMEGIVMKVRHIVDVEEIQ